MTNSVSDDSSRTRPRAQRINQDEIARLRKATDPRVIGHLLFGLRKEKRGRRYTDFENVRRGFSEVANGIKLGTITRENGAVIVQALNGLLATLSTMKAVELNERGAQLEQLVVSAEEALVAGSEPHC